MMRMLLLKRMKLLLFSSIVLMISCKPFFSEPPGELSAFTGADAKLTEESDDLIAKTLKPNMCFIEVLDTFKAPRTGELDSKSIETCIPGGESQQIAWRGRMDVESAGADYLKLSLTVLVDSSGSLKTTDPYKKRHEGLKKLLKYLQKKYQGHYEKLAVKVIYFTFGVQNDTPDKVFSKADTDMAGFIERLEIVEIPSQTAEERNKKIENNRNHTNYLNAFQSAIAFHNTNDPTGKEFMRRLVIFTDGMPWSETSIPADGARYTTSMSATCGSTIVDVKNRGAADPDNYTLPGLPGALNVPCINMGLSEPDVASYQDPGAATNRVLRAGMSGDDPKIDGQVDPVNFRMAMAHHIHFSREEMMKKHGITVQAIYLKPKVAGQCFETRNAKTENHRRQFKNICSNVGRIFFQNLVSDPPSGTTAKNYYEVNEDELIKSFEEVAKAWYEQFAFGGIVIERQRRAKAGGDTMGRLDAWICSQDPSLNCGFSKRKGIKGDFNFHTVFDTYHVDGQRKISIKPEGLKRTITTNADIRTGVEFELLHNFNFSNERMIEGKADQDLCGFKPVTSYAGWNYDGKSMLIRKRIGDDFRITCRHGTRPKPECVIPGKGKGASSVSFDPGVPVPPALLSESFVEEKRTGCFKIEAGVCKEQPQIFECREDGSIVATVSGCAEGYVPDSSICKSQCLPKDWMEPGIGPFGVGDTYSTYKYTREEAPNCQITDIRKEVIYVCQADGRMVPTNITESVEQGLVPGCETTGGPPVAEGPPPPLVGGPGGGEPGGPGVPGVPGGPGIGEPPGPGAPTTPGAGITPEPIPGDDTPGVNPPTTDTPASEPPTGEGGDDGGSGSGPGNEFPENGGDGYQPNPDPSNEFPENSGGGPGSGSGLGSEPYDDGYSPNVNPVTQTPAREVIPNTSWPNGYVTPPPRYMPPPRWVTNEPRGRSPFGAGVQGVPLPASFNRVTTIGEPFGPGGSGGGSSGGPAREPRRPANTATTIGGDKLTFEPKD